MCRHYICRGCRDHRLLRYILREQLVSSPLQAKIPLVFRLTHLRPAREPAVTLETAEDLQHLLWSCLLHFGDSNPPQLAPWREEEDVKYDSISLCLVHLTGRWGWGKGKRVDLLLHRLF